MAENPGGEEKRQPLRKVIRKFWKNHTKENRAAEGESVCEEEQLEHLEQLVEVSRRLIAREEELFMQESPSEEEQDRLHGDLEALQLQIVTAVHDTFDSSPEKRRALCGAVAAIQLQEAQDRRWTGCPEDRVPTWRPQKCLSTHNLLLGQMVKSRLMSAAGAEASSADGLSSHLKREVCRIGKQVKDDLLMVARTVKDCYPPEMDILNIYAGLYQHSFGARLTQLSSSTLEANECSYLLFWVNHYYPQEILQHEELQGKIKTACLGSLLQQGDLNRLEDQYLNHKEDTVKLWLHTALRKEEEGWLSGGEPELIDRFCFSPLAIDVIQVIDGALTESSRVLRDPGRARRITAQLESFLASYKKTLEVFVKTNHGNVASVMKAHLACEEQFSDYVTGKKESLPEEQRRRCLATLAALRENGYAYFTCPVHRHLKLYYDQLWTSGWLDGSLPAVDSLLDCMYQQLTDLADLKPSCRQSLLAVVHQDMVLRYLKRMLKKKTKTREKQVAGAQRMIEDSQKMNHFFAEEGCSESSWLGLVICGVAEVLRLQDPESVQLEMVDLARRFPDLSDAHVSALLSLKNGLTAANIRSIRRTVAENRPLDPAADQSRPFFSKVKVKWLNGKINQMVLKS